MRDPSTRFTPFLPHPDIISCYTRAGSDTRSVHQSPYCLLGMPSLRDDNTSSRSNGWTLTLCAVPSTTRIPPPGKRKSATAFSPIRAALLEAGTAVRAPPSTLRSLFRRQHRHFYYSEYDFIVIFFSTQLTGYLYSFTLIPSATFWTAAAVVIGVFPPPPRYMPSFLSRIRRVQQHVLEMWK